MNAALKARIEDVVAEIPRVPRFAPTAIANDNDPIERFKSVLKTYYLDLAERQKEIDGLVLDLSDMIAEQVGSDPGSWDELEKILQPIWMGLDAGIDEAGKDLAKGVVPDAYRAVVEFSGNHALQTKVDFIEGSWKKAVAARRDLMVTLKQKFQQIVWDCDPDATGGPTFDNSDDLINFLKS